ncbi:hypothetical protein F4780DRAFT_742120 [Xylariomycetidae sp. FL0641]|nr:hypothetical protein F4780DRAFT_742120 [Xylariomycetidae sp. FL0641]
MASCASIHASAGNGTRGPKCLSSSDSQELADNYADLIGNFSADKADALLTDDFVDISDSINSLAGKPLGSTTFPTKEAFKQGQAALPMIPLVIKEIDAVTCDTVTLRWTQTFGANNQPVQGISVLFASKQDGEWKLSKILTEFNSLVYLQNLGGNCSSPAPPS